MKPRNFYYLCFYGMALFRENRFLEAQTVFQKAIALAPDYALAHYQLGRVLARLGDHEEARIELEKAVSLDAEIPEAYYLLGQVYSKLGEKDKAAKALATFNKYRETQFLEDERELSKRLRESVKGEH